MIIKRKVFIIGSVLIMVIGMGFMLYSPCSNAVYNIKQNSIIEDYNKTFNSGSGNHQMKTKLKLQQLKQDVKNYNHQIYIDGQKNFYLSSVQRSSPLNLYNYGFQNNVYGYIVIPKIPLKMSIYLGADDYKMSLGATVLGGSSIPYGGNNTNSVIAGHCGYGGCDYFRYIETLEREDVVNIVIPFGSKLYKVINKKIIEPNDCQSLKIVKNKDLITLMTCYPYPTNKKRICIFCEAVSPRDS